MSIENEYQTKEEHKMTKNVKVQVIQGICAYSKRDGRVLEAFETMEEGLSYQENYEGVSVGTVWMLRAGEEYLDDARGCYPSEAEALQHLKEIRFSHSSEPTDTEGHSYDCAHCGIHYYVFDEEEVPACTVEKTL